MNEPVNPEVAILNNVLELAEAQRDAYLDQACAGDAALRKQVETLLQSHEQAKGFLEAPPTGLDFKRTALVNIPLTEKPGDRIGRYKLLQQIGEGGCGVVYMAEQEEPVRRRVALKVIKLRLTTSTTILSAVIRMALNPPRKEGPQKMPDGSSGAKNGSSNNADKPLPSDKETC